MKFECKKEELKSILDVVLKSVNKKTEDKLNGTNGLNFVVDQNNLMIQSTDNIMSIDARIPLTGENQDGSCIATPDIVQYIKNCPNGTIKLEKKENTLCIKSAKKSIGKFNLIDSEFPTLETGNPITQISLDSKEFKKAIKRVTIASAVNDEARVVLNNTCFDFDKEHLTMAALDGYRICRQIVNFQNLGKEKIGDLKFLIPTEKLLELEKIISSDQVMLIFTSKYALLQINENVIITIKLMQGDYIEYNKVLDNVEIKFSMSILLEELEGAVIRNSLIASKSNVGIIRMLVDAKNESLKITGTSSQAKTEDIVDISVEGDIPEKFEIAFNANYIKDAIKSLDGIEEAKISFSSSVNPALWEIDDENYKGIVLPVRI